MKLYYSKGACSLAVRIALYEMDIPCQFESVDLKTKKTETGEDFLKINPKGAVPTLLLDSQEVLTENATIHQYLADEHKAIQLLPAIGNFNRYRVLEWLTFISTDMHKGFSPLFNPKMPQSIKDDFTIPNLKSKFNYVNDYLSRNQYLGGDHYILPEGYLFVMLIWLSHFKIELSNWEHLQRYFTELKKRPSIQKALAEEGLL